VVKVVIAKLAADTRKGATKKKTSVVEKRVRDREGRVSVLRTVDATSPTLTEDLTYVFKSNVAKARRENKRLFGSADRVPKS
jgi:hypothetical protein